MTRIILIAIILFILALFIYQLKNYLTRDKKIDELKETRLKTHMMDIDKEIAEEKAHQNKMASEIDDIHAQTDNSTKEEKE